MGGVLGHPSAELLSALRRDEELRLVAYDDATGKPWQPGEPILGSSVQVVVKNPDNKVARIMKLPRFSEYPHYKGLHLENDWCEKAGCVPVMGHPGDIGGIDG